MYQLERFLVLSRVNAPELGNVRVERREGVRGLVRDHPHRCREWDEILNFCRGNQ